MAAAKATGNRHAEELLGKYRLPPVSNNVVNTRESDPQSSKSLRVIDEPTRGTLGHKLTESSKSDNANTQWACFADINANLCT